MFVNLFRRTAALVLSWALSSVLMLGSSNAADLAEAQKLFFEGDYTACIEMCSQEVARGVWNDGWARLLIESQLALGKYKEASDVYDSVSERFSNSLMLRMLGVQAYRYTGRSAKARQMLDEIPDLIQQAAYRFTDRENRLTIARYAATLGEDARNVLKAYDALIKSDGRFVDAYIASGELGIEKADYQEAVKSLTHAAELRPEDPYIQFLLAKAWSASDEKKTNEHLAKALELNPRHADSLLFRAQNLIDAEQYDKATEVLNEVLTTNASHPQSLALQAAIAHLRGAYEEEGKLRKQALSTWDLNPLVDHTIGNVLSRHYRFSEGMEYQRRSFQIDPDFVAARFGLAQDLLRLGNTEEGWELVKQVSDSDRYNVEAYNLRTLMERLNKFATLEGDGIWVRMDSSESQIYGTRALDLLQEAKSVLEKKYGVPLKNRVTVEIFPQQSDFAIRTFGLPGGAGFLGVCFGNVITANSPASQGETPANWESVLWHEFCHSITLQMTNNRMPRWLSEGISVYEELERNSSWGQRLNPTYQQMLLGEEFVPLSKLSGAFMNPASPLHLQFAYFESTLAVRYLVDVHGLPTLQRMLLDLGMGIPIQQALANRYGDEAALDADFKDHVSKLAREFHPQTDFSKPKLEDNGAVDWSAILKDKPNNYFAQRYLVLELIETKSWQAARTAVEKLLELYPDDAEREGALELAAAISREQQDENAELGFLNRIVSISGDRVSALTRLIQIHRMRKDWSALDDAGNKLLAVQPLLIVGHEAIIEARRHLDQVAGTTQSLRALQQLKPTDPAGIHYQLAESLYAAGNTAEAKLEVLKALEFSPRYREAQKLLLNIRQQ